MDEIRINLNDEVRFKLTDRGRDIYYHQFDELIKKHPTIGIKPQMPKVDADGYSKMQLWCFMELYGPHTHMSSPVVVEPLEIIYKPRKQRRSAKIMLIKLRLWLYDIELRFWNFVYEACERVEKSKRGKGENNDNQED